MGAATIVLAGLAAGGAWRLLRRPPLPREREKVVVADFVNSTGETVFDDTLKTALQISLRQSPSMDLLPQDRINSLLQMMMVPAGARITPEIARTICLRAGAKAYVTGAIGSVGSDYILALKAVGCADGSKVAEVQVKVDSREQVIGALGRAATDLRRELGESLATVQRFDVPLDQATTASLEALRAYTLAQKAAHEQGAAQSLPYAQKAIAADPNFAMAYQAVGVHYSNLGEPTRAAEYLKKAFELRSHASERERLKIEGSYYSSATGQLELAARTFQETINSYPQDIAAYNNLGIVLAEEGRFDEAVAVTREGMRIAPGEMTLTENLVEYLLALQRFDEVAKVINDSQPKKPDNYIFPAARYILSFIAGDGKTMAEQQEWFSKRPNYENFGLGLAAETAAYRGELSKARRLTGRAVESAVRSDTRESGAVWEAIAAQREAAFGDRREARQLALNALQLDRASEGAETEAALAFALAGEGNRAEQLAQDLKKRFSADTQIQTMWLPAIEAAVKLSHKDSAAALKELGSAGAPGESGMLAFSANASGSCMYPTFLRGEAFLAAGRGIQAAEEFQRILDHSGIVWNCWTGSVARLGQARAYALSAKNLSGAEADAARVRAVAGYREFLNCWTDADVDIPILKMAKEEYARLL